MSLTNLVIDYKKTKNPVVLKRICSHSSLRRLAYGVLKKHGMLNYPPLIIEEAVDECRGYVLNLVLEKYDVTRGVKFETLYTWWCRSYVGAKKRFYQRRANLQITPSVDQALFKNTGAEEEGENSHDYFLERNLRAFSLIKKEIRETFMKGKMLCLIENLR